MNYRVNINNTFEQNISRHCAINAIGGAVRRMSESSLEPLLNLLVSDGLVPGLHGRTTYTVGYSSIYGQRTEISRDNAVYSIAAAVERMSEYNLEALLNRLVQDGFTNLVGRTTFKIG